MRGAVDETIWFFTSIRNLLKQYSYSIFEAGPPSTYMWCMKWPSISASMIIGPFVLSSSSKAQAKYTIERITKDDKGSDSDYSKTAVGASVDVITAFRENTHHELSEQTYPSHSPGLMCGFDSEGKQTPRAPTRITSAVDLGRVL
ncbi:hypothetical protein Tco_0800594 [Tanacetum coccineum]|uniref:Uncharacterized protein n=1 Tax=Tanacetum coccineum TaxID=301880 RepID=A0ABQ4ZVZ2_9ASTR